MVREGVGGVGVSAQAPDGRLGQLDRGFPEWLPGLPASRIASSAATSARPSLPRWISAHAKDTSAWLSTPGPALPPRLRDRVCHHRDRPRVVSHGGAGEAQPEEQAGVGVPVGTAIRPYAASTARSRSIGAARAVTTRWRRVVRSLAHAVGGLGHRRPRGGVEVGPPAPQGDADQRLGGALLSPAAPIRAAMPAIAPTRSAPDHAPPSLSSSRRASPAGRARSDPAQSGSSSPRRRRAFSGCPRSYRSSTARAVAPLRGPRPRSARAARSSAVAAVCSAPAWRARSATASSCSATDSFGPSAAAAACQALRSGEPAVWARARCASWRAAAPACW